MVGIRIRAVLVAMVYNKGLTLPCQAKQERTSGEIINFMTVDAERVGDFSWSMHDPWIVPVQVGLALFILYRNLGLASIAAFLAIIIAMVPNFPLGRLQNRFQVKLMESKDTRMKATSEILRNMRILKLGWERKFLSKIVELRMRLIEEYDSPSKLLENKSSSFVQLAVESTVRSNSSFEK
ncbi:hypothetical protein Patl1_03996 [Pistacia atlantica]|uniref:Uncharacterized protein n=1 Tax=Pistacia atlantica TaxID=434234 RepID=A0ACC1BX11_9ROSI|nr:hypothetical protein Patl1_03996 [Pistacia atlantica]